MYFSFFISSPQDTLVFRKKPDTLSHNNSNQKWLEFEIIVRLPTVTSSLIIRVESSTKISVIIKKLLERFEAKTDADVSYGIFLDGKLLRENAILVEEIWLKYNKSIFQKNSRVTHTHNA
jgi:hypothetical protein